MPAPTRTRKELLALLGDPKRVIQDLRKFRRSTRVLSSEHPRLIDKYERRWVAVHGGKVRANAATFGRLMASVDQRGLPRENIVVRYIDKDERIMIL